MVDSSTGTVYTDEDGHFVADDGTQLLPGWRAFVGLDNYKRLFSDERIRGAVLRGASSGRSCSRSCRCSSTFALGLLLAIVFNNERMTGRRFYRMADDRALRAARAS